MSQLSEQVGQIEKESKVRAGEEKKVQQIKRSGTWIDYRIHKTGLEKMWKEHEQTHIMSENNTETAN